MSLGCHQCGVKWHTEEEVEETDVADTRPLRAACCYCLAVPNSLAIPELNTANLIHVFLMKKPKEDQGMS